MNIVNPKDLKVILTMEKSIKDCTSETQLEPDLEKFESISQMIGKNEDISSQGQKEIKKRQSSRHSKTLCYTLEQLEFCTCLGNSVFWAEINKKEFLHAFNTLLNIKTLPNDVKDKCLYLCQFWARFFNANKDQYPNFAGYYNLLRQKGIMFPDFQDSPYNKHKISQQRKNELAYDYTQEQPDDYDREHKVRGGNAVKYDPTGQGLNMVNKSKSNPQPQPQASGNSKHSKIETELDLVIDNIVLTNQIVDSSVKEMRIDDLLPEMMATLQSLQANLESLMTTQLETNEEFLLEKCLLVMEDINQTFARNERLMNKKRPKPFKSSLTYDGSLAVKQPDNNTNNCQQHKQKNTSKVSQPGDQASQYYNKKFEGKKKNDGLDQEDDVFKKNDMEGYGYNLGAEDQDGNINVDENQKYQQQEKSRVNNQKCEFSTQNNFHNPMQSNPGNPMKSDFGNPMKSDFGNQDMSNFGLQNQFGAPIAFQEFGAPAPNSQFGDQKHNPKISGNSNAGFTGSQTTKITSQNTNLLDMNAPEAAPVQQKKYQLPKKQNLAEVDLFSNNSPAKKNDDNLLDILGADTQVSNSQPVQQQNQVLGMSQNTYANYNQSGMGGMNNMGYGMNPMQNMNNVNPMQNMNNVNLMGGMNQMQGNMAGMNQMQGNMPGMNQMQGNMAGMNPMQSNVQQNPYLPYGDPEPQTNQNTVQLAHGEQITFTGQDKIDLLNNQGPVISVDQKTDHTKSDAFADLEAKVTDQISKLDLGDISAQNKQGNALF